MSYKTLLDNTAQELERVLVEIVEATQIYTEDFGWENIRYVSELFRMAHIERYTDNNLEVLHFTCFPTIDKPDPIFGFDIITTDKKPLAAFLDHSPVLYDLEIDYGVEFSSPYKLPEWATKIFSKYALAIVPSDDELEHFCSIAIDSFIRYINILEIGKIDDIEKIKERQNFYCENQQKNERTFNVLKAKLGEEKAKYFMSEILFPKIN